MGRHDPQGHGRPEGEDQSGPPERSESIPDPHVSVE
jgi:hypothetical protein